ncbi:hypothetical protein JCM33374_g1010 [Metschnikowia sp. JCM 33374]|nr:hypothetical protein JCM33374_g1010 [Metschnikowia sp. JCM 33374]
MRINLGLIAAASLTSMVLAAPANELDSDSSVIGSEDVKFEGIALTEFSKTEPHLYARGDAQKDITKVLENIQKGITRVAERLYDHKSILPFIEYDWQASLNAARVQIKETPSLNITFVKMVAFTQYKIRLYMQVLELKADLHSVHEDDSDLHQMLSSRLRLANCYNTDGEADIVSTHFINCAAINMEAIAKLEKENSARCFTRVKQPELRRRIEEQVKLIQEDRDILELFRTRTNTV